jgi:hypothetical protein
MIKAREAAGKSDADIAAGVQNPSLIHSINREKIRRGQRCWLQQMRLYCCRSHCPGCPHGPYWFLFRHVRSRNEVIARVHGGRALPQETIARLDQDIRPGVPYAIEFEPKKDRAWFERKVAELKTELEKLPADRQEQLRRELEDERNRN